jgi:hypothetical protein
MPVDHLPLSVRIVGEPLWPLPPLRTAGVARWPLPGVRIAGGGTVTAPPARVETPMPVIDKQGLGDNLPSHYPG